MDPKMVWTEPDVVLQIEKEEFKESLSPTPLFWRLVALGVCVLVGAAAISIFLVAPFESGEQFWRWVRYVLLETVFNAAVFGLIIGVPAAYLLRQKAGARCELSGKGLFRGGGNGVRIRWKQIESYRFGDHAKVPRVRIFEFKIRGLERWRHFSFDPGEVDEKDIAAIVKHNLPSVIQE